MFAKTHRIEIFTTGRGARGYRVTYAGEMLLKRCRSPLLEGCRVLLARGITGRLEMWRAGKAYPDMICDIVAGAQLTIIENEKRGPIFGKWSPPLPEAISRARHRARTAICDAGLVP